MDKEQKKGRVVDSREFYEIRGGKSRPCWTGIFLKNPSIFLLDSGICFQYTPPIRLLYPTPNRRPKMAKKPKTKSQILSHFAGKFELTKKTASGIIDEVAALAVSETKKTGSFTLPAIGKLVLIKRKARMGRNPATGEAIKILPRPW
jgi:DNA-binding protein HU-beta